jgi:uncharacterized protein (TIGR02246 family)
MNKDFGIFLSLRRVTVVALSLVSLSAAWATPPNSRDAIETSVRALHTQMIEAYNRGDAARAASTFAPEGTLITGDATRYVTPLEIERYLSRLLAKLPQGTRFIAIVTDVRFVGRDMVVLTSEGGWLYPGETAVSDKNQGIQTLVALRHKGLWRAVLFQRTRKPASSPTVR